MEMLSCIETIQTKSTPIIEKAFITFLLESSNPDDREFLDDESQIKEIFIHGNYLSLEDIKIAQKYDISALSGKDSFENIMKLTDALKELYKEEE